MTHLSEDSPTQELEFDINDESSLVPWNLPAVDFLPTDAPAGSDAKVEVLAYRYRHGLPLWHADDRSDYSGLGRFASMVRAADEDSRPLAKPKSGGRAGNYLNQNKKAEPENHTTVEGFPDNSVLSQSSDPPKSSNKAPDARPDEWGDDLSLRKAEESDKSPETVPEKRGLPPATESSRSPLPALPSEAAEITTTAIPVLAEEALTLSQHVSPPSATSETTLSIPESRTRQGPVPLNLEATVESEVPPRATGRVEARQSDITEASKPSVLQRTTNYPATTGGPDRFAYNTRQTFRPTPDADINLTQESMPRILPFKVTASTSSVLSPELSRIYQTLKDCVASGGIQRSDLERFEREHGIATEPPAGKPKFLA